MVAPGVVLTARHVIEPQQEHLVSGQQEIICSAITSTGLVIWTCHEVTLMGSAGLALLMVRSASALPDVLHLATLTTRLPRVGEKLVIAGVRHHATEPTDIVAELELSMMVAQGVVTARYANGRDRILLPSPCLEVDCPAIGGMSGGPAFDSDGFLVGSVTSSIEGVPGGPTYVSLLWPCFPEKIRPIWPDRLYKEPTSLLQMDRRLCAIHRPEAIEISEAGTTATLHHWE